MLRSSLAVLALFASLALPSGESFAQEKPVSFSRDVLPILSGHCFACHGPDEGSREGNLRLDDAESALAERDGAFAIKPGDLGASAVWQRIITESEDERMPPVEAKKPLTDAQREIIKKWIEQGAKFERHWAFEAPARPPLPTVADAVWGTHPVDRFLAADLERRGLAHRPEASRSTLIRRVAFALTGLPPTPAEVELFEQDTEPQAYGRMVQRYLDSPRFGEEMARHWLDVARYADTHGLHLDNEREMWAYRDWVVEAFNRNLPFDQFTIEQLAGDLLPSPTPQQLVATGFNRCNVTTSEGGSIEAEFLYRYAVDRTSTMVQAWMGLTGGCAVCHDHKYDPLTSREFYSLYSFFYSAADPAMDRNIRNTDPFLLLPNDEQRQELDRLAKDEEAATSRLSLAVEALAYRDPSAVEAPADGAATTAGPPLSKYRDVWLDDSYPRGATTRCSSRNASQWTLSADLPGAAGLRALRQAGASKYEDRFENAGVPLVLPRGGVLEVSILPDAKSAPQALLLEVSTSKGTRRVHWGDTAELGGGEPDKPERLHLGPLPTPGQWTRVEISAAQWGLQEDVEIKSVVLSQFGGLVHWDGLAVTAERAPQADPRASLLVWWKSRAGQDTPGTSGEVAAALKEGPDKTTDESLRAKVREYYLAYVARPATIAACCADADEAQRTAIAEYLAARDSYEQVLAAHTALRDSIPGTFIFKEIAEPRQAHIMLRGQYDKPGDAVQPGVPAVFPALRLEQPDARPTRLDLARWLVSPEHPLTARVAVNRLWQQFFGVGLVKTSEDFGAQGEPPSHPELLDWLAVHYRESGWDTKEFVRLLVTSAAFRQDAKVVPEALQADPENRLLARGPRFRLAAEQLRDNALYVGGLLDLRMGGPGVHPYQPPNIWEPVGYSDSNTRFYLQDHDVALYRRSVYCFLKRTAPPPFMSNFDGPNREQVCARRERSNTPLQALQLLNDTQHFEAARGLGERIVLEGGATPDERLQFAYRVVLSRTPQPRELEIIRGVLDRFVKRFEQDEEGARRVVQVGESSPRSQTPAPELAAYTLVANLLLNLDETINRN